MIYGYPTSLHEKALGGSGEGKTAFHQAENLGHGQLSVSIAVICMSAG